MSSTAGPVHISSSKLRCNSKMALSRMLLGVPYKRHTVIGLKVLLDAASIPFKSSSPKKFLFSTLRNFEKSLSPTALATLVPNIQAYYDARNTSMAPRVLENALRILRRLSREQDENNQDDTGAEKAKNNVKSEPKSEETGPQKWKCSQISKGYRKKKNIPKASKVRECSVCFESRPNKDFPGVNITANCEHDNSVCTNCIGAHVDARVDIGQFGFITCPMCLEALVLEDVRRLCGNEIFEKFVAILSSASASLT